jgi:Rad3-related DNA helicase
MHTQESIARQLVKFIAGPPGNYLVFFPSYAYMFAVADIFRPLATEVDLLIQENRMAEEAREAFLAAYQPGRDKTLVGLAVMGGIFGEGIDLAGDRLTGVAVVGVGLPQISLEREMIRAHFDERDKDGYAYAYVYPGMNKVQQAGGRLIRTENDYGKLLLLDDRFLTSRYQSLLPPEWRDADIIR